MTNMGAGRTVTTSVRLTPEERHKLQTLADVTGRSAGEIIRFLLKQAQLAEKPDLYLSGLVNRGSRYAD